MTYKQSQIEKASMSKAEKKKRDKTLKRPQAEDKYGNFQIQVAIKTKYVVSLCTIMSFFKLASCNVGKYRYT